jgi:hypothetical protein
MFNPPIFYPNPGSYDDVLKRMTRRMQQEGVDNQILEILRQVYEQELQHGIILSRPERKRLFQQVSKAILTDVLRKIGDAE